MRRWSLAVPLLLLLAGCSDKPSSDDVRLGDGAPLVGPDGAVVLPLDANSSVEAPVWQVGDWYGHHVFLGPDDTEGTHINAIVVGVSGGSVMLATDDQQMAKIEAAYDIPILGTLSAEDLSTHSFGATWKIYAFPLTAGAVWAGSVTGGPNFDEQITVNYEATFNAAIDTPYGTFPGFDIVGTTADGIAIITTDYVPAIGWYSRFIYHNVETEDPEDFEFRSTSMGYGKNWTGTYYLDVGEKLIGIDPVVAVDPAGGYVAEPAPHTSFVVAEGTTFLYGYAYSWAWMGASELVLVDPAGQRYEFQAAGVPEGAGTGAEVDLPAVPGEWRVVTAHGGVATGAGAHLWGVTEGTGTL